MLSKLSQAELVALYKELAGDLESRQLLEAYLDSRFPIWRKNAQPNLGKGLGGTPGSGPMTKEEAYKILGLEAGAAAADVREAHRRLMQRLHPDVGGSSFLAARINKAKDVLLSDHN
jgi:DnaJ-domain-containing protein 1